MLKREPIETLYFAMLAASAVALALQYILARLRHARSTVHLDREPRCDACGYILAQSSSPICSECGLDVREHGLVTGRFRGKLSPVPLRVFLALLALPVAVYSGATIARVQPFVGWTYRIEEMVAVSRQADGSFGPPRYAVGSQGTGRYFSRRPKYVWAYCNTDGVGRPMLVVDLSTQEFSLVDASGTRSASHPIEVSRVREVVNRNSGGASDAQVTDAAGRITAAMKRQAAGEMPRDERLLFDTWNGTSLNYNVSGYVIFIACCSCWAILCVLLFIAESKWRKHRRRELRQLWRVEFDRVMSSGAR